MNKAADSLAEAVAQNGRIRARVVSLLGFAAVAAILAYGPLRQLMAAADRSDYYSHIVLIPFVTAYLLLAERRNILEGAGNSWTAGASLATAGLLAYGLSMWQKGWLGTNDFASLTTAASITFLWGGFLLLFGPNAFGAARFPLLFLLFAVPVPEFLLDRLIYVLQVGSTEVTQRLFDLSGMPYLRTGFEYQLPGINIEVARECSGIRSTLALIITGVLAGHLFLKSGRRTVALLIAMLPITILKNGIRILTLSLLAVYVDTRFITDSFLRHSGGFVFYIPALGLMGLVLTWLRKGERR
ncbi:MAG: exosortase/archaeosortase family protein [Syntrophorhabdales bacterium]|jgi:exosortase